MLASVVGLLYFFMMLFAIAATGGWVSVQDGGSRACC